MRCLYYMHIKKGKVQVQIPIDSYTVKKYNQLVSEYYFDLIVLYGDAGKEQDLHVEHVTSTLYPFKPERKAFARCSYLCQRRKVHG